jgi:hypothetical protein
MKLLLIIPVILLSGCLATTPVKRNFPEVPKELLESCPPLKQINPTEKLSEVLTIVVDNYGQYHECDAKSDTWIEWYKTQQQIFESVK